MAQESLRKMEESLRSLKEKYVAWILKNPSRGSDSESAIKLLSYLLHGRLNKSNVLPELIYCSANILGFMHDRLIQQHEQQIEELCTTVENGRGSCGVGGGGDGVVLTNGQGSDGPSRSAEIHQRTRERREKQIQRIRTTLTIIDYLEVFLEVSARTLWGEGGRWIVIIILQSVKTGLRAALLLHYKVGLLGSSTLYHRRIGRGKRFQPNVTFVLKHTGRVVRKIHSAPPIKSRDWAAPVSHSEGCRAPQEMPMKRKIAEVLYLLRPMTHLGCMGLWGTQSWGPWLISLAMDLTSLKLHGHDAPFTAATTKGLRRDEKIELTRRTYALCYYLMRSPFYDTCTKRRLLGILVMFSERVPLVGSICGILAKAIPEWQTTYSYMWTDN